MSIQFNELHSIYFRIGYKIKLEKILFHTSCFKSNQISSIVCNNNFASLCRYVDELLYWSGRRMLLDEYLQGDLTPNRLPPTWVSRTKFVFQSDDGGLAVLDTSNDSVKSLVTNHTLVSVRIFMYIKNHAYTSR